MGNSIILISVEDGNITRSIMRQLSDIKEYGRDFSFYLSKVNLRADSEVAEIKSKIEEQLKNHFDISKNVTPIGKSDGNSLARVIDQIDPEELFKGLFVNELKDNYFETIDSINTYISTFTKDKAENENAITELKNGIEQIVRKRNAMLDEAKDKYADININGIVNAVGRSLSESIEELIQTATTKGQEAFAQNITEIVRHTLISKVKIAISDISDNIINDFSIELTNLESVMSSFTMNDNWLGKITESTKNLFNSANGALKDIITKRKSKGNTDKIYKTITTLLAITTKIVNPMLELVIVFLPDILAGIFGSIQKKKQNEEIRSNLLNRVIPSIKQDLRSKLPLIFTERVNNIINEISNKFEDELQDKSNSIETMENEKQNKIKNIEEEIAKLNTIKENINNISNNLLFIHEA